MRVPRRCAGADPPGGSSFGTQDPVEEVSVRIRAKRGAMDLVKGAEAEDEEHLLMSDTAFIGDVGGDVL